MRVAVTMTVDVDMDAYRAEYGDPEATAEQARQDVRDMVTEGTLARLAPFSDGGYVRGAWRTEVQR